jgi:hypothetical protein
MFQICIPKYEVAQKTVLIFKSFLTCSVTYLFCQIQWLNIYIYLPMYDDEIGKNCSICNSKDYIPYTCRKCSRVVPNSTIRQVLRWALLETPMLSQRIPPNQIHRRWRCYFSHTAQMCSAFVQKETVHSQPLLLPKMWSVVLPRPSLPIRAYMQRAEAKQLPITLKQLLINVCYL